MTFLDSDDFYDTALIEKCMSVAHENVQVIHFGRNIHHDGGRKLNDEWYNMKYSRKVTVDEKLITQLSSRSRSHVSPEHNL